MNEEKHWNNIADNYNQEIFDVFASDKKKLLPVYFDKHANKKGVAVDFGCGNGKAFPYLSPRFKEIVAVDISENLLEQAKSRNFQNIIFHHADLAQPKTKLPKADFVFSCNVIMLPKIDSNYQMLDNISRTLNPGGRAVIVVPASESILFAAWRLIDWHKKDGVEPKDIDPNDLSYFKGTKAEILQGIFYIDGVPTKHYAATEIDVIFNRAGLQVTSLEKLEYDWNTEFEEPPKWMKDPYPWDWLVECKKI